MDDVAIPAATIAREAQNHPAESPAAAWTAAARALVVRELLIREAKRLGVEARPVEDADGRRETEEEALVRALLEQELQVPEADEVACRRYYEQNRARFRSEDLFEAVHILFAADRRDPVAYGAAGTSARAVLDLLRQRPELFPDLARRHSACSSAATGGQLGQFSGSQVTPELASALDGLEPAGPAALVETRYGIHILRLDRRIDGCALPFEAVRERVATWLSASVWRRAVAQYIGLLAGRARIEGVKITAAPTPLVQ